MLSVYEMEAVLPRVVAELDREHYEALRAVVDSYKYIAELTLEPGMTMDRLHELVFGSDAEQPEA